MSARPLRLPAYGGTAAERATMARGLAVLFAAGATVAGATLLLPHGEELRELGVAIPVLLAYVASAAIYAARRTVSIAGLHAAAAFGPLMVATCVWFGGEIAPAYVLLLVWVAVYAAYFFSPRAAAVHGLSAAVAYAIALWGAGHVHSPGLHWLIAAGTLFVGGYLTYRLTREMREQAADLAAVAQMASRSGTLGELAVGTCDALLGSSRADAAVLLLAAEAGGRLEVAGMAGSEAAGYVLEGGAVRDALQAAFARGEPWVIPSGVDRRPVAGLAQPVLREGAPSGVLAAVWTTPRRGVPPRVERAVEVYAAEAGVSLERAERLTREKERRALEINDNIVQGLVVAKYAASAGRIDESIRAIDDTLVAARRLITDALEDVRTGADVVPGDLVRHQPTSL